jgi:hypothetical protein
VHNACTLYRLAWYSFPPCAGKLCTGSPCAGQLGTGYLRESCERCRVQVPQVQVAELGTGSPSILFCEDVRGTVSSLGTFLGAVSSLGRCLGAVFSLCSLLGAIFSLCRSPGAVLSLRRCP